jgi:hypothetical protein
MGVSKSCGTVCGGGVGVVGEARGSIFRRTDGKYFLYLPKHLVEDTAFPFKLESSTPVTVIIDSKEQRLLVMSETETRKPQRKR